MEELSIEQKAKRYDEALEIAKKNYITAQDLCNDSQIALECFKNTLDTIFPELKKSEDERIRKSCIHFLELQKQHHAATFVIEECIAWIEKQGEQKPIEREEFTSIPFGAFDSELIEEMLTIPDGCIATIEGNKIHIKRENKTAIEAIKEEKVDNANKVEPKFKVGDWVITSENKVFQITSIEDTSYRFNNESRYWEIYYCDKECRLWTIQDAKDGDVLVSLSRMHPFIFNGHYDEDTDYVYAYCGISDIIKDDSFYFDKYPDEEFKVWDSAENVRPATRDQCNLLFSKMKDSGYEWDADNKELKLHSNV